MRVFSVIAMLLMLTMALPGQVRRGGGIDETTRVINDCERRTNKFKKTLDKALGRDNVRAGQGREDQLNRSAQNLENQLDKIGDSWNKDHNIQKTKDHVRVAIGFGNDINNAMRNWNMGGDAEAEWQAVRGELNRLAGIFGTARIR